MPGTNADCRNCCLIKLVQQMRAWQMGFLKRNYKHVIGSLIILILIELAVVYYITTQFHEKYIRKDEAVGLVLEKEGVEEEDISNLKVKLKTKSGDAWYEISFEKEGTDCSYKIDAENGEFRSD